MILGTPGTGNFLRGNSVRFKCYKGVHFFLPFFKTRWKSRELSYDITFRKSATYPKLEGHSTDSPDNMCEGDWNKLIYLGAWEPHRDDGANFGWRCTGDDRKIELCWRVHYNGWLAHTNYSGNDQAIPRHGIIQEIEIDKKINLKMTNKKDGARWYVDGKLVSHYPFELRINEKNTYLTAPWFGGGGGIFKGCTAPHKIIIDIHLRNPIG